MPFRVFAALSILLGLLGTAAINCATAVASAPKTVPSSLTLDNDGAPVASYPAPCGKRWCANELRIRWAKGPCYDQRTYPPLAVGWFYKGIPTAKYWPIASPCGTGITLEWSAGGTLNPPDWVKAPLKNQDLVRFPRHANRATVYAFGGHDPTQAQWLLNGKLKSTISLPAADDVTWSSFTGSPSPRYPGLATPTVKLWGRTGSFTDATAVDAAPSNTDGVQFAWFLSLQQKNLGRGRGCRLVNGTYWTDPPVMFEYTRGGVLDGRLNLLTCPTDNGGQPLDFNMLRFGWQANPYGAGQVLDHADAWFNNTHVDGSAGWLPQPPAGADGLYFESDLDDFQSANWLNGGSEEGSLAHPAHVRLETWTG